MKRKGQGTDTLKEYLKFLPHIYIYIEELFKQFVCSLEFSIILIYRLSKDWCECFQSEPPSEYYADSLMKHKYTSTVRVGIYCIIEKVGQSFSTIQDTQAILFMRICNNFVNNLCNIAY